MLSGTPYAHGLNLFHLVGFFVLAGGLVWSLKAIASLHKREGHGGALIVHTIIIGGFLLMFLYELNKESDLDYKPRPEDVITIYKDTVNNSSSIINGVGDTLYFQRNDSTLVNKIDTNSK